MTKRAIAMDHVKVSFEGVSDAKPPTRADWMRQAEADHRTLTVAMGTLRHSNTELAEILGERGQLKVWGAVLDDLIEMEKAHRTLVEDIGAIQVRLLAAMYQAYRAWDAHGIP